MLNGVVPSGLVAIVKSSALSRPMSRRHSLFVASAWTNPNHPWPPNPQADTAPLLLMKSSTVSDPALA